MHCCILTTTRKPVTPSPRILVGRDECQLCQVSFYPLHRVCQALSRLRGLPSQPFWVGNQSVRWPGIIAKGPLDKHSLLPRTSFLNIFLCLLRRTDSQSTCQKSAEFRPVPLWECRLHEGGGGQRNQCEKSRVGRVSFLPQPPFTERGRGLNQDSTKGWLLLPGSPRALHYNTMYRAFRGSLLVSSIAKRACGSAVVFAVVLSAVTLLLPS